MGGSLRGATHFLSYFALFLKKCQEYFFLSGKCITFVAKIMKSKSMKKTFLSLALMVSLTISARRSVDVEGVSFGTSYEETIAVLQKTFGLPSVKVPDKLVYLDEKFEGMKADKVEFGFQEVDGTPVLNQARFYFLCNNKASAVEKMKTLAKNMGTKYNISYDVEEGGTEFYKGGISPIGIGNLFTIYVSPYQGKWTCQVRYGKFQLK